MSKDKETSTQLRGVAEKAPALDPAEEQQKDPTIGLDGPILSGMNPSGAPLLPGTVTIIPQDFNLEGTESDRSDESLGTDAGLDPTYRSYGTDAGIELDYNATSSEEENPNSEDQPVPTEVINQSIQPNATEPINQNIQQNATELINQSIQPVTTETINQNLQPPYTHEGNRILTDKQSTLGNPFNPQDYHRPSGRDRNQYSLTC